MIDLNELERLQDAARKAQNKRIDPKLWAHEEVAFNVAIRNAAPELIADASRYREWRRAFREGECGLWNSLCGANSDAEHDAFIDAALAQEQK